MLKDKIWFTYKARIIAAQRLDRNNLHSQVILILYALLAAILSVISIRYPQLLGENTDILSAVLSIALLTISMLVASRDYRGRAIEMKRNYVAMQSLYNELTLFSAPPRSEEDIHIDYLKLLDEIENHLPIDDKFFRFFEKGLKDRLPSYTEKLQVFLYCIKRLVILGALYLTPAIVFIIYRSHA